MIENKRLLKIEIVEICKKIWGSRYTILNSVWAIPLTCIIPIISRYKTIKIGPIRSRRIGHFVGEGAEQIAYYQARARGRIDIYYFQDVPTCNKFWEFKLKQNLPIYDNRIKYLDRWLQFIYGGKYHRPSSTLGNRDKKGYFLNHGVEIEFHESEMEAGKKWLIQKGIGATPFVCLMVRDKTYLSQDPLFGKELSANANTYDYHSYRDTKISDYKEGIEWLLNQGVGVLRMGKIMGERLSVKHPKFIDYAFDDTKSDFLDYWLFAQCVGAISTSTGPDHITLLHNKPILFLNALPLSLFYSFANCIWVPKNLTWENTGENLNLIEYLQNGYLRTEEYLQNKIKISDLSNTEILNAIQEFYYHKILNRNYDLHDDNIQEKIKDQFVKWDPLNKYHDYINPQSRIGKHWVKSKLANFIEHES